MIGVFGCATDEAEIAALTPSVLDGWMGMGPRVAEFEARLGDHLGAPLVMVDSGSNALQLAVRALDLPAGSEVVVPSLTWVACAHAVALCGHRPVLADVDLDTQNLDPAAVEQALTADTRAIMVVHYAGKPADMDGLRSFGLPIVEDAAHAIDSELDGRRCGTIGEVGIYSFDSVKNLATPDGGGVTAPDERMLEQVRQLRYCGIGRSGYAASGQRRRWWETEIAEAFPRALPNDVSASVGLAQLDKLAANQARRKEIWATYQRELGAVGWLRTPVEPGARERHSYFTYLVRVLNGQRDRLAEALLAADIYTTLRYHPLHLSDAYRSDRPLPNCERLAEEGLNLPLHPRMDDADVERVVEAVTGFR